MGGVVREEIGFEFMLNALRLTEGVPAASFAERGFFRRTDVDLGFLSPWAVMFERADLTSHTLAQRYESQLDRVHTELLEKRSALLEAHRRIATLNEQLESHVSGKVAEQARQLEQWQAEVLDARHQLLTTRDHVIGTEAEVTRLRGENARLRVERNRARKQLDNVRGRLKEARTRTERLTRRADRLAAELESSRSRPSFVRRAARKVLGGAR